MGCIVPTLGPMVWGAVVDHRIVRNRGSSVRRDLRLFPRPAVPHVLGLDPPLPPFLTNCIFWLYQLCAAPSPLSSPPQRVGSASLPMSMKSPGFWSKQPQPQGICYPLNWRVRGHQFWSFPIQEGFSLFSFSLSTSFFFLFQGLLARGPSCTPFLLRPWMGPDPPGAVARLVLRRWPRSPGWNMLPCPRWP